jgi:hypothetical protein
MDPEDSPGHQVLRKRRCSSPHLYHERRASIEAKSGHYEYKLLDKASSDIRLFTLLPGLRSDEIEGCVFRVPLDQAPSCEALSYVWGDPQETSPMSLDGRAFLVTKNLVSAMLNLRLPLVPRTLWIDSICIYSHRTATKHLGTLRFAPQFFEGFNLRYGSKINPSRNSKGLLFRGRNGLPNHPLANLKRTPM